MNKVSERNSIRVNPNVPESIRARVNLKRIFNLNKSEVEIIQIENPVEINPNSD